jgi:hypothetical protein
MSPKAARLAAIRPGDAWHRPYGTSAASPDGNFDGIAPTAFLAAMAEFVESVDP